MATLPRTETDPIASSEVKVERARAEEAEDLKLDRTANLTDLPDVIKARASLGLGTAAVEDSDAFDAAGAGTEAAREEKVRAEQAEALKVAKAGDSMTGPLDLPGDPASPLQAAPKQYVDAAVNALVDGAPGTLDTLKEIADRLGLGEEAETALAALVAQKLAKAANLGDLVDAVAARGNLGLGTAATANSGGAGEIGRVLSTDDPAIIKNVKSFGAKGDDATDDAAAINNAISTLSIGGGGILYFPPGTYVVKANLLLKSKVSIIGAGQGATTIRAVAGVTTAPLYGTTGNAVEDLVIRDLTVDGNYAVFAGNVYGIFLSEAKRVRITNVRVKDTYHIGVFASKCTELLIDKCKLDNVALMSAASPNAIHISEGVRTRVLDNVVTDWGRNKEGHAIYCTASHGAQITGNNVSNPGGIDHLHMIAIVSSNRCIISDNQLDDTGYLGASLTTIGISVIHSNDAVVLGNRVFQPSQNNGSREAIQIDGTSVRASVTGNHCEGGNDNGITLWGLGEHACVGNFVTGASNAAISVNSNNNVVTGNTCKNTGHNTPVPKPAGIAIENPRTGNVIVGNRCYDDQEPKTQTYGIWEINGASGNTITGNDVTGNLTAGLLITSPTTVVGPNQGTTPRGGEVEIRDIGAEAFGDGRHPVTPITGTMQLRSDAHQIAVRTGIAFYTALEKARVKTLTDAAAITPSFADGNHFILSAGGSRTIENVSFRQAGTEITFDIKNNTGGAIVTTWNAGYKLAGAWVDPAPGKRRTIKFYYDAANWIELGRAQADIS